MRIALSTQNGKVDFICVTVFSHLDSNMPLCYSAIPSRSLRSAYQLMISGGDVKAVQGTTGHASANLLVNTYAHIQQDSRKKLGKKFEEGFYKPGATPVQAAPVEAEPTISVSALLELLKDADPAVKAQLRLALLT